jgi:hypothetical protein
MTGRKNLKENLKMKKAGQDFTQVAENGTPFENESYALATPQQTAVITMDDNKDFVADLAARRHSVVW